MLKELLELFSNTKEEDKDKTIQIEASTGEPLGCSDSAVPTKEFEPRIIVVVRTLKPKKVTHVKFVTKK